MRSRTAALVAASLVGAATAAATASAAGPPPPPPKATNGAKVTQVAIGGGLATPTAFAFGNGQIYEADGGHEGKVPDGGVYVLKNGTGVKIANAPVFASGLAFHRGALYVAGAWLGATGPAFSIQKWTGWNDTTNTFAKQTTVYKAPKGFQGFNGLAFGPDGRLYAGVDVGLLNGNDHGPAKSPYVYDILSMKPNGKGLKVFATGIRQPWQMAFAPGSRSPLVSDLGQDAGAKNPPDFILKVHQGDNYGFPKCNWTKAAACRGYAKPFMKFRPHTDIMGMTIIGSKLYVTSFLGTTGKAGEVFSMPLKGGKLKPVLTGFVAPTVGLGAHGKTLYVGELTGQVFSVTP